MATFGSTLSPTVQPQDDWDEETMKKEQILVEDIMPMYVAVAEGKPPEFQDISQYSPVTRALWNQFKSLTMRNGVLYRIFEHSTGRKELQRLLLILPAKILESVVRQYH